MDTLHVELISSGLDAASNGANFVVVCSTFVNMQRVISHCKIPALFVLFKWKFISSQRVIQANQIRKQAMNTSNVDIIANRIDMTSDSTNFVVVYNIFINVHRTISCS